MLDLVGVEPGVARDLLASVPVAVVAVGADEWQLVCAALGDPARDALGREVDGFFGHHAVGRVLAAGHRDQARDGLRDRVPATELAGGIALALEQWTQWQQYALERWTR